MKAKLDRIVLILALILLSSCSSLELTQSRYGNGIGVSFGGGNTVQEEKKAREFRSRKQEELLHKKYIERHTFSKRKPVLETADVSRDKLASYIHRSSLPKTESKTYGRTVAQAHRKVETRLPVGVMTSEASIVSKPKAQTRVQGDLTNLGYLGAVLVIAGLIFMLLGIAAGLSVVVLGVIVIIIAYFLG